MTSRITPEIGLPKKSNDPKANIKITPAEVAKYLKRHKIPISKKAKDKAARFLKRKKYLNSLPKSKEITVSQSDAPWTIIYGELKIGGFLTFLHQGGTKKEKLYHVITLAAHEIESVQSLHVDGNYVSFPAHGSDWRVWADGGTKPDGSAINYTNSIFMAVNLGGPDQSALPDFVSQLPTYWTSEHRQRNCAHVGVIAVYNAELFPNDRPETILQVRGKKVYDPRTETTYYTGNAALIIADYLTDTRFGFGYSWSQVNIDSLIAAADVCDEQVSLNGGGTESRYVIEGIFTSDDDRENILADMEAAMAGYVTFSGGKEWKFWPGVYREPTVTLTEDDLRGEPEIEILAPEAEVFNSITGSFTSRENDYEVTDFPSLSVNAYVTADNGKKIWEDIKFPLTVSSSMCQRIARIRLERSRRQTRIKAPWSLKALQLEEGDNVNINLPRYGFNGVYEVQGFDLLMDQGFAVVVALELKAIDSGVFSWTPGTDEQAISISPNTVLPDPNNILSPTLAPLESGTNHLLKRLDGTIFTRIYVSWSEPQDVYILQGGRVEIQYKQSSSGSWQPSSNVSGDSLFAYILDCQDGVAYDVRVRFVNQIGVPSAWAERLNYLVIGKTERPSNVTDFTASVNNFGINFYWTAITDLDADEYEIRVGESWELGSLVWRGRGTSAKWDYKASGSYKFFIKAFDTTKNQSLEEAQADLIILTPGQAVPSYSISGPNINLSWPEPTGGSFKISDYILKYGPTFATATQFATINANDFAYRADFGGTRSFWVQARDIAGNLGTPGVVTITIDPPNSVQAFAGAAAGNVIQLDWIDPPDEDGKQRLPIAFYNIYKGDSYAESVKIGTKYGTFHAYIERFGGTFTFYVEAVDVAGNIGTAASASVTVAVPRDFYLKEVADLLNDEATLLINAVSVPRQPEKDRFDIFFPVETTKTEASAPVLPNPILTPGIETVDEWWTNNGWDKLQDAVNQDFDGPFLSPVSQVPGQIKWRVDYGATLSKSFINFQYELSNLGDAVDVIPSVSVSGDGVTFTEYKGYTQVFAENFRYVEYILDFEAPSKTAFAKVTLAKATISLKRETEYIIVDCDGANHATGGTPFLFTLSFQDVEDIQATPWGDESNVGIAKVNFSDTPNPTGGKVLLWDNDGTPLDGEVRVSVTGAINT